MARAGQIVPDADFRALAAQIVAPDTYRAAAAELGLPAPTVDYKSEGTHEANWTLRQATRPIAMGPDRLLGGRIFDPAMLDKNPPGPREEVYGRANTPASLPAPLKERP